MGIIKVLPESIANKIAAGEVVERPSSIVKELIENALDAGAKMIEVSIRHGGKSFIRVADDGSGMSAEDAELSFQRYATSKITSADDLARVLSYGFRGEALPSIAAVSRVKMFTRTKNKSEGTEIVIEGSQIAAAKPSAGSFGTVMEVKDLFFNTPARRKFVKSDNTEAGHVQDVVANIALARLDVRFVYKSSDKTIFDLLPGQTLKVRAAAVLGVASEDLVEIHEESRAVSISGVIGKPSIARANRSSQVFFINQRLIRSTSLSFALQAGYHGLLMHGQYPAAVIFVKCDPERVDVNVHPTKQEVRISNEAEIKVLLKNTIFRRLAEAGDLAPSLQVTQPRLSDSANAEKRKLKDFFRPTRSEGGFSESLHETASPSYPVGTGIALEEPITVRNKLGITKILGQIHGTFILAETEEGMIVIDQHAAHEKVMFESLMKNFNSSSPSVQRLLMDELLKLNPKQYELLKKALPMLNKVGFEIEDFGDHTFAIRALPSIFKNQHAEPVLRAFIEEKEDGKLSTALERQAEEVAALIACKRKSVKGHDAMNLENMKSLVEQWARCDNPFTCPHGRPAFFKFSFADLEKQFKRVV